MKFYPSTADIRTIFECELKHAGGGITDVFDDGTRLFVRGVLPQRINVRRGDSIQAGVALRTMDDRVLIHPYTLRQVCTNGAIMIHAITTLGVSRLTTDASPWEIHELCEQLSQTVRDCAHPTTFKAAVAQMRTAMRSEANAMSSLRPLLSQVPAKLAGNFLQNIMRHFEDFGDRSNYGLMNAITATARGIRDPELRWRLEAMGGAVAAQLTPSPQNSGPAMKLAGMR